MDKNLKKELYKQRQSIKRWRIKKLRQELGTPQIYQSISKSGQPLLSINTTLNMDCMPSRQVEELLDYATLIRSYQRTIGRERFLLDILAKALVQNDSEYKCTHKFRRTRIWLEVADGIEISMIHKYRFYVKGLKHTFKSKDRKDVIDTFKKLLSTAFNRSVHIEWDHIKEDVSTMAIYKGEYGIPKFFHSKIKPVKRKPIPYPPLKDFKETNSLG